MGAFVSQKSPPLVAWLRPQAAYQPGDFPPAQPNHPSRNPALPQHIPLQIQPHQLAWCNALSARLNSPNPAFVRPIAFPVEITGEDPSAENAPRAQHLRESILLRREEEDRELIIVISAFLSLLYCRTNRRRALD